MSNYRVEGFYTIPGNLVDPPEIVVETSEDFLSPFDAYDFYQDRDECSHPDDLEFIILRLPDEEEISPADLLADAAEDSRDGSNPPDAP